MTNEMPNLNVAYVTPYPFPDSNATSRRIEQITMLLSSVGAKVRVCCGEPGAGVRSSHETGHLSIHHLNEHEGGWLGRKFRPLWCGERTVSWLSALKPEPEMVVVYGGSAVYVKRIVNFCESRRIRAIVDVVEWYNPAHLPGGRFGPYALSNELLMRRVLPSVGNLIVISKYLEGYYNDRHCAVCRIPSTVDTQVLRQAPEADISHGRIQIVYVGHPGRKDLLAPILEAICQVDFQGERIRLRIIGSTLKELTELGSLRFLGERPVPPCIEVAGRVSSETAFSEMSAAHFTVLLRPSERYAMAGFPTKVSESLAVGTPLICNLTSDLGDYLNDGSEAFLCSDSSTASVKKALDRVLALHPIGYLNMRRAARERAVSALDWRHFAKPLRSLVEGISGKQ
jgi:glycosyltransferase involved in cell wall biosynthesis